MDLDISTRTTGHTTGGDTLIAGYLDCVELGDLGAVGADVVAHIPGETLRLYRCSVDAKFEALAGDVPYVRQDTIREVCPSGSRDLVQQVAGVLLVEVQCPRETTLDKAIVEAHVVGSSLLPVNVGIVGSWAKHVVVRVAELVASRVRAQLVEG